jgi:hypothetical protein
MILHCTKGAVNASVRNISQDLNHGSTLQSGAHL